MGSCAPRWFSGKMRWVSRAELSRPVAVGLGIIHIVLAGVGLAVGALGDHWFYLFSAVWLLLGAVWLVRARGHRRQAD